MSVALHWLILALPKACMGKGGDSPNSDEAPYPTERWRWSAVPCERRCGRARDGIAARARTCRGMSRHGRGAHGVPREPVGRPKKTAFGGLKGTLYARRVQLPY